MAMSWARTSRPPVRRDSRSASISRLDGAHPWGGAGVTQNYDVRNWFELIRALSPDAVVFQGASFRWPRPSPPMGCGYGSSPPAPRHGCCRPPVHLGAAGRR